VVGKTEVNKVYDPACGSGSLLLKFAKVLGHDKVRQGFFGQEINLTTYNTFRDGAIPVTGTAITKILPPVSRFSKSNNHPKNLTTKAPRTQSITKNNGLQERSDSP
jgi:hypothetical protein